MSEPEAEEISLHHAADKLGVHYMTAYRYVRTGQLPAIQRGRRWMVTIADVEKFIADPQPSRSTPAPTADAVGTLMQLGDEEGAWEALVAAGVHDDPLRAQQELIVPALRQIGESWARGQTSIAQEHVASTVALRLIARLGTPRRRGRRSGTVVVCCGADDPHTLATALFANLVQAEGANVVDLGPVSTDTLLAAIEATDGPVSVAIAVTGHDLKQAIRDMADRCKSLDRVKAVLVGGVQVPDETTAAAYGSDLHFPTAELAAMSAAAVLRD